jgi:hypothetical protein
MHKVIRMTTGTYNSNELEHALNDGYVIISATETHSANMGLIIYVLKKDT